MDAVELKTFMSAQIAIKIREIAEAADKEYADLFVIKKVEDYFHLQACRLPGWETRFAAFVKEIAERVHD